MLADDRWPLIDRPHCTDPALDTASRISCGSRNGTCVGTGSSWFATLDGQRLMQWPCLYVKYQYIYIYMGVSKNRGTPKWMVYNGKPY